MTAHAAGAKDAVPILLPAGLLVVMIGALAVQLAPSLPVPFQPADLAPPASVILPPGTLAYRPEGHFLRDNVPVDGPIEAVVFAEPLEIMAYQVSAADYGRCVTDGACAAPLAPMTGDGNVPVTGVSFQDAEAYAHWLSARTGQDWTLPTDAEWAHAAAERYEDDALGLAEGDDNPALRWIANYRQDAARNRTADPDPRPLGSFGANSKGLMDLAGNVWEWTQTCHRRVHLDQAGAVVSEQPACTIRVLEGKHRAATSFFIRDAKSGGCSVGIPPDNLGFRLVRRPAWHELLMVRLLPDR
jgi:formylglycine-generating enzyme required for sulfatase activity